MDELTSFEPYGTPSELMIDAQATVALAQEAKDAGNYQAAARLYRDAMESLQTAQEKTASQEDFDKIKFHLDECLVDYELILSLAKGEELEPEDGEIISKEQDRQNLYSHAKELFQLAEVSQKNEPDNLKKPFGCLRDGINCAFEALKDERDLNKRDNWNRELRKYIAKAEHLSDRIKEEEFVNNARQTEVGKVLVENDKAKFCNRFYKLNLVTLKAAAKLEITNYRLLGVEKIGERIELRQIFNDALEASAN